MLALGIILILLSLGAVWAAIAGATNETVTFDLSAFTVNMNMLGVFLTGAATVLLLLLGLGLVRAGMHRANRRRKETKELHRLTERERDTSSAPGAAGTDAGTSATGANRTPDPGATGDGTVTGRPGS